MPHWISESILAIVNFVPAQFVAEDSPRFILIRAMFALMFIVLILLMIAMLRPLWSAIARSVKKTSKPTDNAEQTAQARPPVVIKQIHPQPTSPNLIQKKQ